MSASLAGTNAHERTSRRTPSLAAYLQLLLILWTASSLFAQTKLDSNQLNPLIVLPPGTTPRAIVETIQATNPLFQTGLMLQPDGTTTFSYTLTNTPSLTNPVLYLVNAGQVGSTFAGAAFTGALIPTGKPITIPVPNYQPFTNPTMQLTSVTFIYWTSDPTPTSGPSVSRPQAVLIQTQKQ